MILEVVDVCKKNRKGLVELSSESLEDLIAQIVVLGCAVLWLCAFTD